MHLFLAFLLACNTGVYSLGLRDAYEQLKARAERSFEADKLTFTGGKKAGKGRARAYSYLATLQPSQSHAHHPHPWVNIKDYYNVVKGQHQRNQNEYPTCLKLCGVFVLAAFRAALSTVLSRDGCWLDMSHDASLRRHDASLAGLNFVVSLAQGWLLWLVFLTLICDYGHSVVRWESFARLTEFRLAGVGGGAGEQAEREKKKKTTTTTTGGGVLIVFTCSGEGSCVFIILCGSRECVECSRVDARSPLI